MNHKANYAPWAESKNSTPKGRSRSVFRFRTSVSLFFHFLFFKSPYDAKCLIPLSKSLSWEALRDADRNMNFLFSPYLMLVPLKCITCLQWTLWPYNILWLKNILPLFLCAVRYKALPFRELQNSCGAAWCQVQRPPVNYSLIGWPWKWMSQAQGQAILESRNNSRY